MVTKNNLKATAGWAVSRMGFGGPQDEAMHKLRDGCEAAIEYATDVVVDSPIARNLAQPSAVHRDIAPCSADVAPRFVPSHISTCSNGGSHRYNIHTQRCLFCDRTYLDIVGHQPEFMGKE